jgi:hypothetical protein
MGFWKNFGKIALKVAPYAAMAIPGVGIPLGMALQGGLAAANSKVSGGSWKDALLAGGIGAGTGAVAGGALKGIGPSSGVGAKLLKGAAGAGEAGKVGVLGKTLGDIGINAATSKMSTPQSGPPPQMGPLQSPIGPSSNPFGGFNSGLADSIAMGRQNARKRMAMA